VKERKKGKKKLVKERNKGKKKLAKERNKRPMRCLQKMSYSIAWQKYQAVKLADVRAKCGIIWWNQRPHILQYRAHSLRMLDK
jgi:hypothetical protein